MPALGLSSAAGTSPHLYVKAADDRHPHDVLLVLRLGVLQDDGAVTVLAASGERNVNLLIHPAWARPWVPPWPTARHFACWPVALLPVASVGARSPPAHAPVAAPETRFSFRVPSPDLRSHCDQTLASI